ncbi:MAG: TetR/AcrR family transcriptional regulator [Anaerolineales bacterium]|nr:TetR/AcrR family transcriptional regulator [Anaerolineales bacterium]
MGKIDPRVKRTRRLLGNALVSLILEKAYEQITIKEITDRAEVAYITFFRHYDSIDELLMQVLGNGMTALRVEIEKLAAQSAEHPIDAEGSLIFEHVALNHELFQILLESSGAAPIRKQVQAEIAQLFLQTCDLLHREGCLIPGQVAANHIAASLLALIEYWLVTGMPYSTEQMGRIYGQMINGATVTAVQNAEVIGN